MQGRRLLAGWLTVGLLPGDALDVDDELAAVAGLHLTLAVLVRPSHHHHLVSSTHGEGSDLTTGGSIRGEREVCQKRAHTFSHFPARKYNNSCRHSRGSIRVTFPSSGGKEKGGTSRHYGLSHRRKQTKKFSMAFVHRTCRRSMQERSQKASNAWWMLPTMIAKAESFVKDRAPLRTS